MPSTQRIGIPAVFLKYGGIFLVLLAVDLFSKALVKDPIYNTGFFLGSFQWTSPFYRIFCSLILLALTLLVTPLIQFFFWRTSALLTAGLSVMEAGIVGNGIDRLRFGAVRDFIPFPVFGTYVINIADIFQWAAMLMILSAIWRKPLHFWPEDNERNLKLVFPKSQIKMVGFLLLIVALVASGNFLVLTAYLKSSSVFFSFSELTLCFGLFLVLTLVLVFLFGFYWSQRIYGPFRAVVRHLEEDSENTLKLRNTDEKEIINAILSALKRK